MCLLDFYALKKFVYHGGISEPNELKFRTEMFSQCPHGRKKKSIIYNNSKQMPEDSSAMDADGEKNL